MPRTTYAVVALALGAALMGCQDLAVENTNAPDRDRAIANPADVETLAYSAFQEFWARTQTSGSAANTMPTVADEMTATYANNASLELSSEPRPIFNNSTTSSAHGVANFQWSDWYEAVSSVNDVLIAIAGGLVIETQDPGASGPTDNTERTRAWAKLWQGIAFGYLGMLFDQAFIAKEDTDISDPTALEPQEYSAVVAAGIESLQEAIDLATGAGWTVPATAINGFPVSADEMVRIAHSFIARFLVYSARSPADRAAVDWATVIQHLNAGITADFAPLLEDDVLESSVLNRAQNSGSFQQRADSRLVGPADVSGNWEAWNATPLTERTKFLITTPDRRITGATDDPTSDGKYFRYLVRERFRPERGLYHFSWYQWYRFEGRRDEGLRPIMTVDEMRLIRAEAEMHLGNPGTAATLINVTRVANGELPPLTAAGVPTAPDCVPQTTTGACGDLAFALQYERMLELAGMDALRGYLDSRGFGRLAPGTFLHFPIPAIELQSLGLPLYTFGGVGGSGSAP